MKDREMTGPVVDAVIHLRGDEPLMARVGGKNVLLVPRSVSSESLAEMFGGLPPTVKGAAAMSEEDPITVWGRGAGTAVVGSDDDARGKDDGEIAHEDDRTRYGPGVRPSRQTDPNVMTVDLDGLLDPLSSAGLRADPEHLRGIGEIAYLVVAPGELAE